jgi:hypothetical protein
MKVTAFNFQKLETGNSKLAKQRRYAAFGSNISSGVFGPIFPSFTRRAMIEPMVRLCLRDLVEINSPAQLLANLLIFSSRPRFAALAGGAFLERSRSCTHRAVKGPHHRRALVYRIGHERLTVRGIYSVR